MTVTTCLLGNLIGVCVFLGTKWLQERIVRAPKYAPLVPPQEVTRTSSRIGLAVDGTVMEQLPDGRIVPARLTPHNCPRCGGNPKTTFCGHCGTRRYDPPKDATEPYVRRTFVTLPGFGPPIVEHVHAPAEYFTDSAGPR